MFHECARTLEGPKSDSVQSITTDVNSDPGGDEVLIVLEIANKRADQIRQLKGALLARDVLEAIRLSEMICGIEQEARTV